MGALLLFSLLVVVLHVKEVFSLLEVNLLGMFSKIVETVSTDCTHIVGAICCSECRNY